MPYLGSVAASCFLEEFEKAFTAIHGTPFPTTPDALAAIARLRRFVETYYVAVDEIYANDTYVKDKNLIPPQIARITGHPEVRLWTTEEVQPDPSLLALVPRELAVKHCAIPLGTKSVRGTMHAIVAFAIPNQKAAIDDLEAALQLPVFQVVSWPSHIEEAIKMYYPG